MDHEVGGRLELEWMVLPECRAPTWCSLQNAYCCTVGVRLKRESYSDFLHHLVALPHRIVNLSDGLQSGRATCIIETLWWIMKWEGDLHYWIFLMDQEVGGRLALVRMVLPGGRPPTWCCLQNYCCYTVGVRLKKKKAILSIQSSFTI